MTSHRVPLFPRLVDPPYAGRGRRPRAQEEVLYAVRNTPGAGVADLAQAAHRSRSNTRRCLRLLRGARDAVDAIGDAALRVRTERRSDGDGPTSCATPTLFFE